jgi:hypothetical protein
LADRPGAIDANTKNRAAEKIVVMNTLTLFSFEAMPVKGNISYATVSVKVNPFSVWQSTCQQNRSKFSEQILPQCLNK